MKTEPKAITPAEVGLTLAVLSGPRGAVLDNWPCIEYTCELLDSRRRVLWSGHYRLGVGHVKPLSYDGLAQHRFNPALRMTANEENFSHHWARGAVFKKEPAAIQLQAATAAKLAAFQKVKPKLEDVCHSLLLDGSAFFDGQRFEDWAADFGYSADSIKAKETFEACDRIGRDLARGLSRDELTGLREWASNY
jgi:hypothetical protein